jgi:hypothetical protein
MADKDITRWMFSGSMADSRPAIDPLRQCEVDVDADAQIGFGNEGSFSGVSGLCSRKLDTATLAVALECQFYFLQHSHQILPRPGYGPEGRIRCRVSQNVSQLTEAVHRLSAAGTADWALKRLVRDQEVGGSNPLAPTNFPSRYQAFAEHSSFRVKSILGSLGSIEPNLAGTSNPTPHPFATSFRNATSALIRS